MPRVTPCRLPLGRVLPSSVPSSCLLLGCVLSSACADEADGPLPSRSEPVPLQAQPPSPQLVTFTDPDTGFSTQSVHDVDREIIHFDAAQSAMIWGLDGTPVRGWTTEGNELRWNRAGGFQVRFGTEDGERRAYFTEAGPGTICNLDVFGPDQLSIRPTNETPPQP